MPYGYYSPMRTRRRRTSSFSAPNAPAPPAPTPTSPIGSAPNAPAPVGPAPAPSGPAPNAPAPPVLARPLAPSAPPAPPKPVSPYPGDATYTDQTALNLSNLQKQQAEYGYQQQQLNYDYFDPTNPYNKAAALLRAYQQGQSGQLNQMAAGGQLYSGALQRGLDEGTYRYGGDRAALTRQYTDLLHQIQQGQVGAQSRFEQGNIDARLGAIQRAVENRPEDPGAPTPPVPPGYSVTGTWTTNPQTGEVYLTAKNAKGDIIHIYENGRVVGLGTGK